MIQIRHVVWTVRSYGSSDQRGRVGVRWDDSFDQAYSAPTRVELVQLSGPAPVAGLLLPLLQAAFEPEDWAKMEELHRAREYPWRVEQSIGMSGARTFRLLHLRSPEWADVPTSGAVHVSMYGKLNEGLKLQPQDVPPLVAAVAAVRFDGGQQEVYSCRLASTRPTREDWFQPVGSPSGLVLPEETLVTD